MFQEVLWNFPENVREPLTAGRIPTRSQGNRNYLLFPIQILSRILAEKFKFKFDYFWHSGQQQVVSIAHTEIEMLSILVLQLTGYVH